MPHVDRQGVQNDIHGPRASLLGDSAVPAPAGHSILPFALVRKVVFTTSAGAFAFGAIALYADLTELTRAAQTVSLQAIAIALGLAAGNFALRSVRFHGYLRGVDPEIPWTESVEVFLCGFAMSMTPGKVGEIWKSVLLRESRNIAMASTAPIIVAERVTDLISVALLTALGAVAFEGGIWLAVAGLFVAAALVAVCSYRRVGNYILDLTALIPVVSRLTPRLRVSYEALLSMLRPSALLSGTAIGFVAWGLECGSLYVIARAFPDISLSAAAATFAFAASTIAGAAAMLPGGLGVTEVGMTSLIFTLGTGAMTQSVALALTMLTRIVTLWFAVAVGLAAVTVRWARRA